MTVATDKTRISAYVPDELEAKARQLAEDEGRSLSNYIERLLIAEVLKAEAEGKTWKPRQKTI